MAEEDRTRARDGGDHDEAEDGERASKSQKAIRLLREVTTLEPLPGGGACSQDPLTFLDFIPCSPLLKPLVPKNDFSSCSLDPQNYCAVPLIPRNFYPCSPYLFTCFTFLFIVKEIAFEPPLSSPCNPFMLKFIDRHFCQLN